MNVLHLDKNFIDDIDKAEGEVWVFNIENILITWMANSLQRWQKRITGYDYNRRDDFNKRVISIYNIYMYVEEKREVHVTILVYDRIEDEREKRKNKRQLKFRIKFLMLWKLSLLHNLHHVRD